MKKSEMKLKEAKKQDKDSSQKRKDKTDKNSSKKKNTRTKKRAKVEIIEDVTRAKKDEVVKKEDKAKPSKKDQEALISFFYTSDKFMNQFEDEEIIEAIQKKFPNFMKLSTDSEFKRDFALLIEERNYLEAILKRYDMNIQDFFMFILRKEGSLFKGPYIKKIKRILETWN